MEEIDWEYEAPKFVDFEAEDHLLDDTDEYFDRAHDSIPEELKQDESSTNSEKNNSSALNKNDVATSSSEGNSTSETPRRKTFNIPTSSRGDCASGDKTQPLIEKGLVSNCNDVSQPKKEEIDPFVHTPSRETYGVKTPSQVLRATAQTSASTNVDDLKMDISEATVEEKKENEPKCLANVITPGRVDTWCTSKLKFNEGKGGGSATIEGGRRKVGLRRSLRILDDSKSITDPPKKKPRKESPKVNLTGSGKIPHSHTHRERHLTSEERELEKIRQLRSAAKESRKEGEKLVKKLRHSITLNNSSSKMQVTRTKEFHFRTDERAAKTHSMSTRSQVTMMQSNFKTDLRAYGPSPIKKSKTTIVKPFNLSQTKRKQLNEGPKPLAFVPMAEAIMDFQNRTPRRFKLSKHRADQGPPKPLRTTIPKTPNITKPKSHTPNILSSKEKEELEIEEMKKHQFKANPVSNAILSAPEPIKKVEKKPLTKPIEFQLSSGHPPPSNRTEIKVKPFTAQPVPDYVFEKPKIKKKPSLEVTVPMSPAFALKHRMRRVTNESEETVQPQRFFHPPPKPGRLFKPKLRSSTTEVAPFSFDASDKERFSKKEDKIKEIKDKEASEPKFKAQPMPVPISPSTTLPPKQMKEPTKPEPFQLQCHERVALRVNEFEKQVEEDVKSMREKARFKAKQDYEKITKGKPWEPKIEHKPATEPIRVSLRSEMRAKEREEFEKRRQMEIAEKEFLLKQEQMRKKENEHQEIKQLRKVLVHKAQEIPKLKGVTVAQSRKPLTQPKSPNFSDRFNK